MDTSRRDFLTGSAALFTGAWLSIRLPWADGQFETLTPAEARTLSALVEQIIPTTHTPGAREAGAVYFIDRSLAGTAKELVPVFRAGLRDLDERAANLGKTSFAELPAAQQIALLREIEPTRFFSVARDATMIGTFGDPRLGGNRKHIGYRIMNVSHSPVHQPPFGYYDAEARKAGGP